MNVFFCYCLSTLPLHLVTAFKHPLTPASWCVYEPLLPVFKSRENRASNLQVFQTNIKNFLKLQIPSSHPSGYFLKMLLLEWY